jgi:hypothetical protein
MSSKLHIGKLPYTEDSAEISICYACNLQFTTGLEIILTIEELEILTKALFLKKILSQREIEVYINDYEKCLLKNDPEEMIYLEDIFLNIKNNSGFYGRNLKYSNQSPEEGLLLLKKAYNETKVDNYNEKIKEILDWAKEYFIEGKHYFYTL